MRGPSRWCSRRVLALVACLGWLLGVEGLPALHQAHHDNDHTHDAAGAVIHSDHEHADVVEHHDDDLDQLAIDHPDPPRHQSGGLAHHAVALQVAAPPVIAPVTTFESRVELTYTALAILLRATQPAARGPPA